MQRPISSKPKIKRFAGRLGRPRYFGHLLLGALILLTDHSGSAQLATPKPQIPDRFSAIFTQIESIYEPLAKREGAHLKIEVNANDDSASASAHRDELDKMVVRLANGFITQANLNEETLRFTICHELGHLFGGRPRRVVPMEWTGPTDDNGDMVLSAEAQSDYYATLTCMRLVLREEDNLSYVRTSPIDAIVRRECDRAHKSPADSALCQRASMAGYGMLRLLHPFPISFGTPAQEVAPETIRNTYPTRQCRLDTILAGAMCSPKGAQIEACSSNKGELGFRPACWFKESARPFALSR